MPLQLVLLIDAVLPPNFFAAAVKLKEEDVEPLPNIPDENGEAFDTVEPKAAVALVPPKIVNFIQTVLLR